MRSWTLTIMVTLFSFATGSAQLFDTFGIKSGVSLASQDFDYSNGITAEFKNRAGTNVGLFFESPQFGPVSVVIETC